MKELEFETQVSNTRTIQIPPNLAEQVDAHQLVHVVVTVPDSNQLAESKDEASALMATFGSCPDSSLITIFDETDRQRHTDHGRPINLS